MEGKKLPHDDPSFTHYNNPKSKNMECVFSLESLKYAKLADRDYLKTEKTVYGIGGTSV